MLILQSHVQPPFLRSVHKSFAIIIGFIFLGMSNTFIELEVHSPNTQNVYNKYTHN